MPVTPLADCPRPPRRRRRRARTRRRRRARQRPRGDRARRPGDRRAADGRGLAVPHRLDRQADHGGGDAGPRRRRRGGARRSGRRPPARAGVAARRAHADVTGRRHRAGEPGDHGRRPAALDERPRLPVRLLGPGRRAAGRAAAAGATAAAAGAAARRVDGACSARSRSSTSPARASRTTPRSTSSACSSPGPADARSPRTSPSGSCVRSGWTRPASRSGPAPTDRRTSYYGHGEGGDLELLDGPDGQWASEPPFPSGAGGLVSTAADLVAFQRMLLAGGGDVLPVRARRGDDDRPADAGDPRHRLGLPRRPVVGLRRRRRRRAAPAVERPRPLRLDRRHGHVGVRRAEPTAASPSC